MQFEYNIYNNIKIFIPLMFIWSRLNKKWKMYLIWQIKKVNKILTFI